MIDAIRGWVKLAVLAVLFVGAFGSQVAGFSDAEKLRLEGELISVEQLPADLISAYNKFVEYLKDGDFGVSDMIDVALPGVISLPFRIDGFYPDIALARRFADHVYLIRTPSAALWYVKLSDGKWWIYRCVVKPIQ